MIRNPPRGVPRDEWLLAVGLSNHGAHRHANLMRHGFIHHVAAWIKDAPIVQDWDGRWLRDEDSDELAAMMGAHDCAGSGLYQFPHDAGNPDAYAAGAALAMALEAK